MSGRILLLAGALAALAIPVHASMLSGQTVQTTYFFPSLANTFCGPVSSVVGAGVELSSFCSVFSVDFSDTNILIKAINQPGSNNVAFDGFKFFDINGTIPDIMSVSINPATNYAGVGASNVTFDANDIFLNLANTHGQLGQVISLDLNSVPEPSSVFLLAALLVAVLTFRRFSVRRVSGA